MNSRVNLGKTVGGNLRGSILTDTVFKKTHFTTIILTTFKDKEDILWFNLNRFIEAL